MEIHQNGPYNGCCASASIASRLTIPAWSATAGSGDTLAGIAGALLAAGLDAWRAGAVAASLQARAAAILPGPRTPSEVASRGLPDAIMALRAPD